MELIYGLSVEAEIEVIRAKHRAALRNDPLLMSYTAECQCGWVGQEEKSKLSAERHYLAHVKEEEDDSRP